MTKAGSKNKDIARGLFDGTGGASMGPVELERDWQARGFSFGVWTDPPGQQWKNFVHETDELVMLKEGKIEISFQGNTIRPQVGEEVFIPAGAMHTLRNVGNCNSRWYYGYRLKR